MQLNDWLSPTGKTCERSQQIWKLFWMWPHRDTATTHDVRSWFLSTLPWCLWCPPHQKSRCQTHQRRSLHPWEVLKEESTAEKAEHAWFSQGERHGATGSGPYELIPIAIARKETGYWCWLTFWRYTCCQSMPLKNWCSFTSVALQVRNTGGGVSTMLFLHVYTRWQCSMDYINLMSLCRFTTNDQNGGSSSTQLTWTHWQCGLSYWWGQVPWNYSVTSHKTNPLMLSSPNEDKRQPTPDGCEWSIWTLSLIMGETELVGACTIPLALTAKPLGNISLQQPLQQVFELSSERLRQLHVLRAMKRGQKRGGRQRKDRLKKKHGSLVSVSKTALNKFKQVRSCLTISVNNCENQVSLPESAGNILMCCKCLILCSPNWDLLHMMRPSVPALDIISLLIAQVWVLVIQFPTINPFICVKENCPLGFNF